MIILFFLIALFPLSAKADEISAYEKAEKRHQKIVESCKAKSQPKWDTGVTQYMMEGSYDYVECLTNEIIKISDIYFVDFKKKEHKEDFLKQLRIHTESAYELYWILYHGACSPCGTMYRGLHINSAAGELENILKTMLRNAYEHGRPLESFTSP